MTAAARDDAVTPEAIEAAVEAFRQRFWESDGTNDHDLASVMIVAALPALREAIAQKVEWTPGGAPPDDYFRGYRDGLKSAARIVRKATP